jgi:hypothetical protein
MSIIKTSIPHPLLNQQLLQDFSHEINKLLTEGSQRYHLPLDLQRHGQMTAHKLIPEETIISGCNFRKVLKNFSHTLSNFKFQIPHTHAAQDNFLIIKSEQADALLNKL